MGIRRVVVAGARSDEGLRRMQSLAHSLREAGHEVVLIGDSQSPEQIVFTAIAEDANAIGIPDADADFHTAVRRLLAENVAEDIELLEQN